MEGRAVEGLRRDLGRASAYAALVGTLVGAGIFRVTSDSWALTGPSVILAHLVLAVPVLATSVGYAVFLSTPLGRLPGGEYTHLRETFGSERLAFLGAWLKIIAYLGAFAFLARVLADHLIPLTGGWLDPVDDRLAVSLGCLLFFFVLHSAGVRWFGRAQVFMCVVLAASLLVLVIPGLFAIDFANYRPFFSGGAGGFLESLVPLFFAWAGFESVAQAAGEVKDSTRHLPRVFLRGVLLTTVIYLLMSLVTFGALPGAALATSETPMADVAAVYLPRAGSVFVTVGAVFAVATSLNASLLVPSRLCVMLAADGLVPRWLGHVDPRTGTPLISLTLGFVIGAALLVCGQLALALNIAVFALLLLYLMHSAALLALPRLRPDLEAQAETRLGRRTRAFAATVSIAALGTLVVVQVVQDGRAIAATELSTRLREGALTASELAVFWVAIGLLLLAKSRRR